MFHQSVLSRWRRLSFLFVKDNLRLPPFYIWKYGHKTRDLMSEASIRILDPMSRLFWTQTVCALYGLSHS
jgi:hypothetical protein